MRSTDEWLSVTELARKLGVSASTVRGLIHSGRLHAVRHTEGGRWQTRESECDRYLAALESSNFASAA